MSKQLEEFLEAAEKKAFDKDHRRALQFNIGQYDKKVAEGKQQFSNLELAKSRAAAIKQKSIDNLEKYLIEFEANFIKRGGKVIWAQDAEEATREILQLMQKANAKLAMKSKSMATEEIGLNEVLQKNNIQSTYRRNF